MADGTIDIDVLLHNEKFNSDIEHIKKLLTGLGDDSGDKMESSFRENANKITEKAESTHRKVKDELGKPVTEKFKADTKQINESMSRIKRNKREIKDPVTTRFRANFDQFNRSINSAKTRIKELREESGRLKGVFSGSALGSFAGNMAASGFASITGSIHSAISAIIEYNDKQQVMNATWKTLTGSAKQGQGMVDMVNNLSTSLGQDVDVTDELAQQFYHVYNNKPQTEQLTKSFLTMGDAIGLSGDRLKQVGMDFTHTMSSGIMQLGDFNQMSDAFPMFGENLLKYERKMQNNTKLTMGELRKQMSAGKISATDAATVFNSLGKKYQDAADNLMQTLPGMTRKLKTQIPKLFNDMLDPIEKARNPIVGQISEWSSDPKTEQEFTNLGKKVSVGMGRVMKAFSSGGSGNLDETLDKTIEHIGDGLSNSLNYIAKHADSIKTIASSVTSITKDLTLGYIDALGSMFKIITGAKGDGIDAVANGLDRIAANKNAIKAIGGTLAVMWAAKKALAFAAALNTVYKSLVAIKTLGAAKSSGNLITDIVGGTIDTSTGKRTGGLAAKSATKSSGMIKVTPYLDERGFLPKVKSLFSKLPGIGRLAGLSAGTSLMGGLTSKISGSKIGGIFTKSFSGSGLSSLGKTAGGRLVAGLSIAVSGFDIYKGLTKKKDRASNIGKGIGGLIGTGIGAAIGGPAGAAIGAAIGNVIGGAMAKKVKKSLKDAVSSTSVYDRNSGPDKKNTNSKSLTYWKQQLKEDQKQLETLDSMQAQNWGTSLSKGRQKQINAFQKAIKDDEAAIKKLSNSTSSSKSKSSTKESTEKAVSNLGSGKVNKASIANVKSMTSAIKKYGSALKGLKDAIKHNDPTTELNKMNRDLTSSTKNWSKLASPIRKMGSAFKTLASFSKSMSKNDTFSALAKDIPKLDNTLKKQKIGSELKTMGNDIKKSKLASTLKSLTTSISNDTSKWTKFAKPVKTVGTAFKQLSTAMKSLTKGNPFKQLTQGMDSFAKAYKNDKVGSDIKSLNTTIKKNNPSKELKTIGTAFSTLGKNMQSTVKPMNAVAKAFNALNKFTKLFGGKSDPFSKLNTEFKTLDGTLNHYNIGKDLSTQIGTANTAVKKATFASGFKTSVNSITSALKSFKRAFNNDWKDLWDGLDDTESKGLSKVNSKFDDKTGTLSDKQDKFQSKFKKSWDNWLDSLVSSFKKDFDKLPDQASKSMNKVVSAINKGIGGLNSVIDAFGGKKLKLAKYATGTRGSHGGLAVVGEQGMELAYDKKHGIYPVGTHGEEVRYLDDETSIMPHEMSNQFMSMVAGLPHHADGKNTDAMIDYIMEHSDDLSKNPLKYMKQAFFDKAKFTGDTFTTSFGPALSNGFLKAIQAPFKKLIASMANPPGSGVARWRSVIVAAAAAMGASLSGGQINKLLKQIQTESGGNPTVKQGISDINSRLGHPAQGLLQFIPSTFNSWALPGHHQILNGADQIMAAINALNHGGEGGWGNIGNGHGWANGGHVTTPQVAPIAEDGDEWVINPARDNADSLLMQAINARISKNPDGVLGRATTAIKSAKVQAHQFAGRTLANSAGVSVSRGDALLAGNGDTGSLTINSILDSRTIANATYPLNKAKQAKEINVTAKKEGLH